MSDPHRLVIGRETFEGKSMWGAENITVVGILKSQIKEFPGNEIEVDMSGIKNIDSIGVANLIHIISSVKKDGKKIRVILPEKFALLIQGMIADVVLKESVIIAENNANSEISAS